MVTPVYRELENQNLGYFLLAYAGETKRAPNINLHLVFVVNDLIGTDPSIQAENTATLNFLKALCLRKTPSLAKASEFWMEVATAIKESSIQIHLLDQRGLDLEKANIGQVRKDGGDLALRIFEESELPHTLIDLMDADSLPGINSLNILAHEFKDPSLDYSLARLESVLDASSPSPVSRRFMAYKAGLLAIEWNAFFKHELPISGTPRITVRADKYKVVGGVPPIVYAEDMALLKNLGSVHLRGKHLPHLINKSQHRGRLDGYDAASILKSQHEPVELSDNAQKKLREIKIFKDVLTHYSVQLSEKFKSNIRLFSAEHLLDVGMRRRLILERMKDPELSAHWSHDAFLRNAWLPNYLSAWLDQANHDGDEALQNLSRHLPDLLSLKLTEISQATISFQAAIETWNKNNFDIEDLAPFANAQALEEALVQDVFESFFEAEILQISSRKDKWNRLDDLATRIRVLEWIGQRYELERVNKIFWAITLFYSAPQAKGSSSRMKELNNKYQRAYDFLLDSIRKHEKREAESLIPSSFSSTAFRAKLKTRREDRLAYFKHYEVIHRISKCARELP